MCMIYGFLVNFWIELGQNTILPNKNELPSVLNDNMYGKVCGHPGVFDNYSLVPQFYEITLTFLVRFCWLTGLMSSEIS